MKGDLFDTHCHLDDARFDEDREAVFARMRDSRITHAAVIGADMDSSQRAVSLAQSREGLYAAVGIHPHDAKFYTDADEPQLKAWLHAEKVVALGEIGLDYYYNHSEPEVQREVCIKQMALAHECQMPVIFHVRDAHNDMLTIMKAHQELLTGGIIHCFSGSVEMARTYLDYGFYISIAGPVTFKKAPKLSELAAFLPLDRMLIETDSPYLSPEPKRGKRNEPAFVAFVAHKLAEIKGMSYEDIAQATMDNAKSVYRI